MCFKVTLTFPSTNTFLKIKPSGNASAAVKANLKGDLSNPIEAAAESRKAIGGVCAIN
jgi:hypothetical protein